MSASSKGSEIERRAKALLESQGYVVHRTIRTPIVKWGTTKILGSHNNDVFGVYDLVARHTRTGSCRFIQVTDSHNFGARQKKVERFCDPIPKVLNVSDEVWGWVGGRKRRSKQTGKFLRRQYFRRSRWSGTGWEDVTPPEDGWID